MELTFVRRVPSDPPRTELIAWIWGYNWCSKANKISDTPDICNPSTNRAVEFKHIPFTDKFGAIDWSCYANVNIYFYGCGYNPDGTVNYDNVRANFVSQAEGGMFPQQQQDYDCTYDTENRACPYNPGYGMQTEFEGFMSVSRASRALLRIEGHC